jgi:hypothetical protein
MPDMDQTESFEQARAGLPDISPDLSVYWKPLHRLFVPKDGTPLPPVTILLYDLGNENRLPFAAIAKTRKNRLILWPPSHAHKPHEFAEGDAFPIHHVTLELSNGKTHFTRFDPNSKRIQEGRGWKLAALKNGLKLWLIGAFQVAYLEKQIGVVGGKITMPKTDSKRREDEFRRYAEQMTSVAINTPPLRGDCLITVIHLLPDSTSFCGPIGPAHFPMGSFWNEWIEEWPDGDKFQAVSTPINVGGVNLLLLTAAPLGRLKSACFLGSVDSHSGAS